MQDADSDRIVTGPVQFLETSGFMAEMRKNCRDDRILFTTKAREFDGRQEHHVRNFVVFAPSC